MTERSTPARELGRYGQEHVLAFWDRLDEAGRARLAAQVEGLDLGRVAELAARAADSSGPADLPDDIEPPPVIELPETPEDEARFAAARERGAALVAEGRVGVLLVAGGQGTRLGFDGPKGAYPIGPVTDRSIFRIHAHNIRALERRHGGPLPWYIMTSEATDEATREFFEAQNWFGLAREDVIFFKQGAMPAVDFSGRLMLDAPDHVAESPNGHGGVVEALDRAGALEDMNRRGIDTVFYYQVDNALLKMADPVFLGFHDMASAEMSSKVVCKTDPTEKVGFIARWGGRVGVIEYSDLPDELARARTTDGRLRFRAGSIGIHVIARSFLERLAREAAGLPFHVARKRISHLDADGRLVEPDEPNGFKFEMFVFDALREARTTVTLECRREDEFAPVKNPTGTDSVESARAMLVDQYARWLEAAGADVPRLATGSPARPIEIDPLVALDAADLAGELEAGSIDWSGPVVLECDDVEGS